ncbi:MAG: FIST C-terminal domain-containing protein [Deltaproteobacteria bacterium]|nr:FIST C-terminal domain-containing protein [Deltaproteobacteria bacterium]
MLVAQTLEPDEPEAAVRDILAQLDLDRGLRRNSACIVHCNDAFMESGVAKAVSERLPFPTAGINTFLNSSSGGITDSMLLTASVLTSDDCRFATGLSEPMGLDVAGPAARLYVETENLLDRRPALGLVFAPFHGSLAIGETVVEALDEVSDGVPFFGTVASDYTTSLRRPRVIHNGETYDDRASMILIEGPVVPRFRVFPVSLARSIRQKAIITDARDNVILQVNGMPALDFLEALGLCRDGQIQGVNAIPLSIDRGDGTDPVFRAIVSQTPEGGIVIGGRAPAGAMLGIGAMDQEHILCGAKLLTTQAGPAGVPLLIYSCLSRNIVLGFNYTLEADQLRAGLQRRHPYSFAYSTGEICPVPVRGGRWRNAFHNMTLVAAGM